MRTACHLDHLDAVKLVVRRVVTSELDQLRISAASNAATLT